MTKDLNDELSGGEEVKSTWFKFEKVGDYIKGTLLGKRFQKGTEPYPDQWIYEIKNKDGVVNNVGISSRKLGTIQRLNSCQMGEIIAIVFDKELPPVTKGMKGAKALVVKTWGMDPTYEVASDFDGEVMEDNKAPFEG